MLLVLGATGFLGKNICHKLDESGIEYSSSSLSLGVDLRDQEQVNSLFEETRPKTIINCSSFVGGLQFGLSNAKELYINNLEMTLNLYKAIDKYKVEKIINPISNCTYPAQEPLFKVDNWWNGPMHESVFVYGFVKKAVWAASKSFSLSGSNLISNSIILPNMYGPGDHIDEYRAHALGGMVLKFLRAKKNNERKVTIWGTGSPVREWLHIRDGAEALVRSMGLDLGIDPINIGRGHGETIKDLAFMIKEEVGIDCEVIFDTSKQDGDPIKTLDGSTGHKALSWKPEISLKEGLKETVVWYKSVI